jgi:hypothetical protein
MSPYFRNLANEKGTKANGNFCLFTANGKHKRQTSVCLLQTETEKMKVSFPWSANDNW